MLNSVGLFAGIGGIEEGFRQAGWQTEFLCEIDEASKAILARHFRDAMLVSDIRELRCIPHVDLVAAGFPCQDLSQAGRTKGLDGNDSGLIREVFRLLGTPGGTPRWVLLENVPFMLHLDRGRAMRYVTKSLEELGFTWAYRVVDTRSFGLPQRRRRLLILASKTEDPRGVLLGSDAGEREPVTNRTKPPCGFYWTEGNRGLGWAIDAIPPLKTGSKVSIPAPPAIWVPLDRKLTLPDIRDAERLQGFSVNWTKPMPDSPTSAERQRWRLVGNAVSVPVAKWIAERIQCPRVNDATSYDHPHDGKPWGMAGWGHRGKRYITQVSDWPVRRRYRSLSTFLKYPAIPLSARATAGFLKRVSASRLRLQSGFLEDIAFHLERVRMEIN